MLSVPLIFNWARSNVTDGAVSIKFHTLIQSRVEPCLTELLWATRLNNTCTVYIQIHLIYLVLSLIISFSRCLPWSLVTLVSWSQAGEVPGRQNSTGRLQPDYTLQQSVHCFWDIYTSVSCHCHSYLWMTNQPFWVTHLRLTVRRKRFQSKRSVVILAWKRAAEPITKFGNKWEKHGLLDGD